MTETTDRVTEGNDRIDEPQRRPFHSYSKYRDSGVEWLGEIPAHWDSEPFKATRVRNDSGVWGEGFDDDGTIVLRSTEQTKRGGWRKTLEFKSSLRWNLKEKRKVAKQVTHAALKTIAAFLNTEGGDLLIGVDDDRKVLGIAHDRLETDDKFMLHLAQVVRNGLGDPAGTCIDPKTQIVEGKTVCLVSCQRSPEPVYLRWKGLENGAEGDLYVRSGPGTVRLSENDAGKYVATRFASK